jgi:zinc protease
MQNHTRTKLAAALAVLTLLLAAAGEARLAAEPGGFYDDLIPPGEWEDTSTHGIETFILDNGLQVVVFPMLGSPYVTAAVWYKVGAADDPAGKSGLAHLVEHATVRSVGGHAEPHASRMAAHGDAEMNAFTSYDYTAYASAVPLGHLEEVLHTEATRMASLVITPDILTPERDEVRAERCQERGDTAEAYFDETLRARLFGAHPYGRPVLGWASELQRLTLEDVNTFYRTWYAPNNAILIVAGDFATAELRPLVQRYFGDIPARPMPTRRRPPVPAPASRQRLIMSAPSAHKLLWQRTYLAPSYTAGATEQVYALQILAEVLGAEPAGRLWRTLVHTQRVATAVDVRYLPDSVGMTTFSVYAVPAPGITATALEQAIDRALQAVATTGVSRPEVQQAQHRLQDDMTLVSDSSAEVTEAWGMALTAGRTVTDMRQWQGRIAAVTVAQLQAAAKAVLRAERAVTGVLRSSGSAAGDLGDSSRAMRHRVASGLNGEHD